jgi:hypothetical protein
VTLAFCFFVCNFIDIMLSMENLIIEQGVVSNSESTLEEVGEVILYRIENKNIKSNPDGVISHDDLIGQWFTPSLDTALNYLRKSQKYQEQNL